MACKWHAHASLHCIALKNSAPAVCLWHLVRGGQIAADSQQLLQRQRRRSAAASEMPDLAAIPLEVRSAPLIVLQQQFCEYLNRLFKLVVLVVPECQNFHACLMGPGSAMKNTCNASGCLRGRCSQMLWKSCPSVRRSSFSACVGALPVLRHQRLPCLSVIKCVRHTSG